MGQKPITIRERAEERSRRIKSELEHFGTLRELHQEVRERLGSHIRGTSYGAVRAIVEGEVDHPRPNVTQAIAEVLGVRSQYLLDLTGPRTSYEEATPGAPTLTTSELQFGQAMADVRAILRDAFPTADAAAFSQLWRLWSATTNREAIKGGSTVHPRHQVDTEGADPRACAEQVVRAITAPLDALGVFLDRERVGTPALDGYIISIAQTLWTALADEEPRLRAGRTIVVRDGQIPEDQGDTDGEA